MQKIELGFIAIITTVLTLGFTPVRALELAAESGSNPSEFSSNVEITLSNPQVLGISTTDLVPSPTEPNSEFGATASLKQAEIEQFYTNLDKTVTAERELTLEAEKLRQYLAAQGSPVATTKYAKQIIRVSRESGADYRILIAIMGTESGFCRVNYLTYNCFGYLNNIQYSSFDQAFNRLIPAISKQYAIPYGTDFRSMAKAYGIANYPYHSERMARFYQALR